jgi:hypothetical protein
MQRRGKGDAGKLREPSVQGASVYEIESSTSRISPLHGYSIMNSRPRMITQIAAFCYKLILL